MELVAPTLLDLIETRKAIVGIIGLGYVGLPLAVACGWAAFPTIGFDIDEAKVAKLNSGQSYIDSVNRDDLRKLLAGEKFRASSKFEEIKKCDVVVICVPTPLSRHREPDLQFVVMTAETISKHLRRGQLVVLESTTYPGTTEEVIKPILQRGGFRSGREFFLGFSPEREDPGNKAFGTMTIPKVVAGDDRVSSTVIEAFYRCVVETVIVVSSPKVAEAVKITENVFRSVNIALVNELKVIYDAMGIDIWEVIDAAATKPFGYMPFYPGPGLGGHCIPIDPFYLTWKSREYGLTTRFIELAGEINVSMPRYVVGRLEAELDYTQKASLGSASVLILGLAYKRNVSDIRESPSFALMELLERRNASVDYYDPFVAMIPETREHAHFAGRVSIELTPEKCQSYNAIVVVTDHDNVDYQMIADNSRLVIDTRNVFSRKGIASSIIVKS